MKTTPSFSIDFLIRRCKDNKKKALIYARITVDEERKEISLKEQIDAADWDPKKESVKGKTEAVKSVNQHIEDVSLTWNIISGTIPPKNTIPAKGMVWQKYSAV